MSFIVRLLLVVLVVVANGSKFDETFMISDNRRVGPIVEGPMYGTDGGFVGFTTGTPFVGFEGTATFIAGDEPSSIYANLTVYHTFSPNLLSVFDRSLVAPTKYGNSSLCDETKGVVTKQALHAFGRLESSQVFGLSAKTPTRISYKSPVSTTGYQYIIFAVCRKQRSTSVSGVDIEVSGQLTFRNPYGFLPARYYGFLPFLGILSSIYLLMLLIFGYLSVKYRKAMLRMQWGVLGVIVMGMVETTTWFLTYVVMNDTGATSCCPWRTDIVFAMFLKNLKQMVSAMLVLAVSTGWGVFRPSLSRRVTIAILMLGFFYLSFAVKFDLVRMERISQTTWSTDDEDDPSGNSAFWALPVAFCDVLFIIFIYFALIDTSSQLENDRQEEKLKMYRTLSSTLRLWGILWFGFTIFDLLTRIGVILWPWTLEFLLWGFWDAFYLGVLLRIAIIWRPTETSDRYAYSAQLPTEHVLDEFESQDFQDQSDAQEAEMTKTISKA